MQSTLDNPDARLPVVVIGALLWCEDTDAGVPMMADASSVIHNQTRPVALGATTRPEHVWDLRCRLFLLVIKARKLC
jgi:hypothetical protein